MMISSEATSQMKDIAGDKIGVIMENYFKSSLKLIDDIKVGISENNANKIAMAAHPLKSSSNQVGAVKLGEIAKDVELSAKAGNLDGMDIKLQQITDLYTQSAKLLREAFGI